MHSKEIQTQEDTQCSLAYVPARLSRSGAATPPGRDLLMEQGITAQVPECLKFPEREGMPRQTWHQGSHTFFLMDWNSAPAFTTHTLLSSSLFGRCYRSSDLKRERPCHWTDCIVCHGNIRSRKRHCRAYVLAILRSSTQISDGVSVVTPVTVGALKRKCCPAAMVGSRNMMEMLISFPLNIHVSLVNE